MQCQISFTSLLPNALKHLNLMEIQSINVLIGHNMDFMVTVDHTHQFTVILSFNAKYY